LNFWDTPKIPHGSGMTMPGPFPSPKAHPSMPTPSTSTFNITSSAKGYNHVRLNSSIYTQLTCPPTSSLNPSLAQNIPNLSHPWDYKGEGEMSVQQAELVPLRGSVEDMEWEHTHAPTTI